MSSRRWGTTRPHRLLQGCCADDGAERSTAMPEKITTLFIDRATREVLTLAAWRARTDRKYYEMVELLAKDEAAFLAAFAAADDDACRVLQQRQWHAARVDRYV